MKEQTREKINKSFIQKFNIIVIAMLVMTSVFFDAQTKNKIQHVQSEEKLAISEQIYTTQTTVPNGYTAIRNSTDLLNINSNLSGKYILMSDIDMTGINFTPIGTTNANNANSFNGTLEGNNYAIKNLSIEAENTYIGLFAKANGAVIQNLKMENIDINVDVTSSISSRYIGSIVGYFTKTGTADDEFNYGKIRNVSVDGKIENNGNITNVYIGGIAGYSEVSMSRCINKARIMNLAISQTVYIGGIVGQANGNKSIVRLSQHEADIISGNSNTAYIGGIAGKTTYAIIHSYSKGARNILTNSAYIGGIAGENYGKINYTYAIDQIDVTGTATIGGIAGRNTGTIGYSYYNSNEDRGNINEGEYKTLQEMKQMDTYQGWNFDEDSGIWEIRDGVKSPELNKEENYIEPEFWQWNTRETTSDQAYNGVHIELTDTIYFRGYGNISYKDFLYKKYDYPGKKIFKFQIDETKGNYHTLNGTGFFVNAKQDNGKITGEVILIEKENISAYRLEDVDIETFKTQDGTFEVGMNIEQYSTEVLARETKPNTQIHKLVITASPTNITIIDNNEEIINIGLDASKHAGEDFGPLVSYVNHNCNRLSQLEFSEYIVELKDFKLPVTVKDDIGNIIEGAKFQIKNSLGETIREGNTNINGLWNVKGLKEGSYTLEQIQTIPEHIKDNNTYSFRVTNTGKMVDTTTGAEIQGYNIINSRIKAETAVIKIYQKDTTNGIKNAKIALCDESENTLTRSGRMILDDGSGQNIEILTNSNGEVDFAQIVDLLPGTYYYKEISCPSNYIIDSNLYSFEVDGQGNVTFDLYNGKIYNIKDAFTIIWKNEDGTELERDENVRYGQTPSYDGVIPTKPPTQKYSYTFNGWNPEVAPVEEDQIYTAKYTQTINKYTIIWKNEDGTELEKDENVEYGTTPEYNGETPTKAATEEYTYEFDTWTPAITTVRGNTTYTATYLEILKPTVMEYEITYELNGGSLLSGQTNPLSYTSETETFTLINPTKVGYTFLGWTGSNGSTPNTHVTIEQGSSGFRQYIARWEAKQYTIKYNGNGSTKGSTQDSIHTYDSNKNLTKNGYAKEYTITYNLNYNGSVNEERKAPCEFVGWTTTQDGNGGNSYNDEQSVINLTTESEIYLYAQWANKETKYIPKRVGYTFEGWYTDEACTTSNKIASTNGTYMPTGDITLYANWKARNRRLADATYNASDLEIVSNKYEVLENEGYILKINPNTNIEDFKKDISTNGDVKILNKNGDEADDSELIGTGYEIEILHNGEIYKYIAIVKGDINGDGKSTVTDISLTIYAIVGKNELKEEKFFAADVDFNGKIGTTDLSMIIRQSIQD